MREMGIDAYIIPHADEYQNEFLPEYAKRLAWLTGFTGSAGYAAVLQDSAAIFVDGRYTIQVRSEVEAELYAYEDYTKTMPWIWLADHMQSGQVVGYDPSCWTISQKDQFQAHFAEHGLTLKPVGNLIDPLWSDQPAPSALPPFIYEERFAGRNVVDKINDIKANISEDVGCLLLTQLDSIAWLSNLRGSDVECSPFFLATAILDLHENKLHVFMALEKIAAMEALPETHKAVQINDIAKLPDFLETRAGKCVQMDPKYSAAVYKQKFDDVGLKVKFEACPVVAQKAVKNATEQSHIRHAHCKDGAAIAAFLCWFDAHKNSGTLDELKAEEYLIEQRRKQEDFFDISFDPISGFGPNGAIVHYRASEATNKKIEGDSLYLIDSGGQYLDGTTDLTRTVAVGKPSQEMKERFTLVLKGHIAMASAVFPEGVCGAQLDQLARAPLWREGLDYAHGTGHGVGMFLNVHEGPAGLSPKSKYSLKAGMLLSNEPGYYKAGEYGIRIENLVLVKDAGFAFEDGRQALCFETVSLVPIDRSLIIKELLSESEIDWLNTYHADVWQRISPLVKTDGQVYDWLNEQTRPLN